MAGPRIQFPFCRGGNRDGKLRDTRDARPKRWKRLENFWVDLIDDFVGTFAGLPVVAMFFVSRDGADLNRMPRKNC